MLPVSDNELEDPAASTQMFQAFVDRQEPEESGSRWVAAAFAVAAVAIVLMLAWLLWGG
jgi:hypothetical protein